MNKKQETSGFNKVCLRLDKYLKEYGFSHTRHSLFTRICPYWIEFGHIHKFTFSSCLRVHFGIRILSDKYEGVSLNGPDSDSIQSILYHFPVSLFLDQRKYSFDYEESEESVEKCAKKTFIFWKKVGLPWFKKWRNPKKLIDSKKSPLSTREKELLEHLVCNTTSISLSDATKKEMGLS